MEKDINIKWIEDFAPIYPETIEQDIKSFISALQERPHIYFETYRANIKYQNLVSEIVEAINSALKIKLKKWQIDYIFYDCPIPREVKNMRWTGVSFTNALKLCVSQGPPISLEPYVISNRDFIKLAKYLDDDCDSLERLRIFIKDAQAIYNALDRYSQYIPLRIIKF